MNKEIIELLGGLIALSAYFLLANEIRNEPRKYNAASMFLWAIVDAMVGISIYLESGNYILAGFFVLGSYTMGIILWSHKKFSLNEKEICIIVLIIICGCIWKFSGNISATIATSIATILAGIPQYLDTRKNPPHKNSITIWILFCTGSIVSFLAGDGWDIRPFILTRLFPLANILISGAIIISILNPKQKYR